MSLKEFWNRVKKFIKELTESIPDTTEHVVDPVDDTAEDTTDVVLINPKSWDKCTKSSNWTKDAAWRMMNMLSPGMSDAKFEERLKFIKSRGCNYVNLFLCNKGDGECANYSIYGNSISWKVNNDFVNVMKKRINRLYKDGYGIVLWLTADDSKDWNSKLIENPERYCKDLKDQGLLDYASIVVVGLEVEEYWTYDQCKKMTNALRKVYSGKVAIHQQSGHKDRANLVDIFFYQTSTGKNASQIKSESKKICTALGGKPVCFFELSRKEDRKLSEAALSGGAFSVGNW